MESEVPSTQSLMKTAGAVVVLAVICYQALAKLSESLGLPHTFLPTSVADGVLIGAMIGTVAGWALELNCLNVSALIDDPTDVWVFLGRLGIYVLQAGILLVIAWLAATGNDPFFRWLTSQIIGSVIGGCAFWPYLADHGFLKRLKDIFHTDDMPDITQLDERVH
jgi:hypothetical protein